MITAAQIRRARELLGWTPYRLAPRAGMGHTLLRQFEAGARTLDPDSEARLRAALEEVGVEFLTTVVSTACGSTLTTADPSRSLTA